MDTQRIRPPLNQFLQHLPPTIKVDQLVVFGSYLEGNATQDSDIDVVVISDNFKTLDEDQRLDVLYTAAEQIEPVVHPWGFTQEEFNQASALTLLGYVRTTGYRFV